MKLKLLVSLLFIGSVLSSFAQGYKDGVESAGLWRNIKRRRLLVVERTAADIARATLP